MLIPYLHATSTNNIKNIQEGKGGTILPPQRSWEPWVPILKRFRTRFERDTHEIRAKTFLKYKPNTKQIQSKYKAIPFEISELIKDHHLLSNCCFLLLTCWSYLEVGWANILLESNCFCINETFWKGSCSHLAQISLGFGLHFIGIWIAFH